MNFLKDYLPKNMQPPPLSSSSESKTYDYGTFKESTVKFTSSENTKNTGSTQSNFSGKNNESLSIILR